MNKKENLYKNEKSLTGLHSNVELEGQRGTCDSDSDKMEYEIKWFVYLVAICASFGGLLFGYDIGGSGGTFVMPGFRLHFSWPLFETTYKVSVQQGLITSLFAFGAMIGSMPSGYLCDRFGRRKTLFLACCVFVVGTSIQTATTSAIYMMLIGRFIGGIAIGSLSCVVPMYQSELAPVRIRGKLVTLQQLCITFGIALAGCLNIGLITVDWGWRFSYGGNIIFALIMMGMLVFLPESPRWLVLKNKLDLAIYNFSKIRVYEEIDSEIESIMDESSMFENMTIRKFAQAIWANENHMSYRLFVGCAAQIFQQLSGINAIMFFAPEIFDTFFSSDVGILGLVVIQIGNFLSTFIAIALIDVVGRRSLLLVGGLLMMVSCFVIAVLASPSLDYKEDRTVGYLIIAFCCFYVVNFAYSWGPVVWVLCSEIFPNKYRGYSMSVVTMCNWGTAAVISYVAPLLYRPEVLNLWGTFIFFGCMCGAMVMFVWFCVPETANVPLEQMTRVFRDHTFVSRRKVNS